MMMLASEKHGKKQGSTRAANQPHPTQDGIERLISAPSTPKSGNFKGIKDPVNANDEQETEQANEEETHEELSLEAEMETLAELNQRKEISDGDLKILMDYIDEKITKGVPGQVLAARMRSPAQRSCCLRSMKKDRNRHQTTTSDDKGIGNGKPEQQRTGGSFSSPGRSNMGGHFASPFRSPIQHENSASDADPDGEWLKFADEHDLQREDMDEDLRVKWRSVMSVKISQAMALNKEIGVLIRSKRFSKLRTRDVFERWLEDRAQYDTLCGK